MRDRSDAVGYPLVLLRICDNCQRSEERTFTDTYTGLELCVMCLAPIINQVALSPQSEDDNLEPLLEETRT
jgi:hypothetical protein